MIDKFTFQHQSANMSAVAGLCESPIETSLARSLFQAGMFKLSPSGIPDEKRGGWVYVVPQYEVGRYRLDFALFCIAYDGEIIQIDLECDGKEFHSTADQVRRDADRNATLVSEGWVVLRYRGGPVHHRPNECANEIQEFIECVMGECPPYPLTNGACFGWDTWAEEEQAA